MHDRIYFIWRIFYLAFIKYSYWAISILTLIYEKLPVSMVPNNLYSSTSKFVLLAIPFFILGGNIMEKSGISKRLIDFCRTLVGHKKSGMAMVCVIVACLQQYLVPVLQRLLLLE